jgi:hypothetical protein
VLVGFEEGPLDFPPTFKYDPGCTGGSVDERLYNEQRVPSYCDRILWHSLPARRSMVRLVEYGSLDGLVSSDHRPVRAVFDLETPPRVSRPSLRSPEGARVVLEFLLVRFKRRKISSSSSAKSGSEKSARTRKKKKKLREKEVKKRRQQQQLSKLFIASSSTDAVFERLPAREELRCAAAVASVFARDGDERDDLDNSIGSGREDLDCRNARVSSSIVAAYSNDDDGGDDDDDDISDDDIGDNAIVDVEVVNDDNNRASNAVKTGDFAFHDEFDDEDEEDEEDDLLLGGEDDDEDDDSSTTSGSSSSSSVSPVSSSTSAPGQGPSSASSGSSDDESDSQSAQVTRSSSLDASSLPNLAEKMALPLLSLPVQAGKHNLSNQSLRPPSPPPSLGRNRFHAKSKDVGLARRIDRIHASILPTPRRHGNREGSAGTRGHLRHLRSANGPAEMRHAISSSSTRGITADGSDQLVQLDSLALSLAMMDMKTRLKQSKKKRRKEKPLNGWSMDVHGPAVFLRKRAYRADIPKHKNGVRENIGDNLPAIPLLPVSSMQDLQYEHVQISFWRARSRVGSCGVLPLGEIVKNAHAGAAYSFELPLTKYGRRVGTMEAVVRLVVSDSRSWTDGAGRVVRTSAGLSTKRYRGPLKVREKADGKSALASKTTRTALSALAAKKAVVSRLDSLASHRAESPTARSGNGIGAGPSGTR